MESLRHVRRRKMRCESKGQAKHGRKLRTEEARAQQPDGNAQACSGNGANFLTGCRLLEIGDELPDILGKIVCRGNHIAAQRAGCGHVRSGSAPEAKLDAARVKGGERAELFRDDERRM